MRVHEIWGLGATSPLIWFCENSRLMSLPVLVSIFEVAAFKSVDLPLQVGQGVADLSPATHLERTIYKKRSFSRIETNVDVKKYMVGFQIEISLCDSNFGNLTNSVIQIWRISHCVIRIWEISPAQRALAECQYWSPPALQPYYQYCSEKCSFISLISKWFIYL